MPGAFGSVMGKGRYAVQGTLAGSRVVGDQRCDGDRVHSLYVELRLSHFYMSMKTRKL